MLKYSGPCTGFMEGFHVFVFDTYIASESVNSLKLPSLEAIYSSDIQNCLLKDPNFDHDHLEVFTNVIACVGGSFPLTFENSLND